MNNRVLVTGKIPVVGQSYNSIAQEYKSNTLFSKQKVLEYAGTSIKEILPLEAINDEEAKKNPFYKAKTVPVISVNCNSIYVRI